MKRVIHPMIGFRFGRLVVVSESTEIKTRRRHWLCNCDCGRTAIVEGTCLRTGHTQSCGCLHRETTGRINFSHGRSRMPEYNIWAPMIQRCHNPEHPPYRNYGGRGIGVCERWRHSFVSFIDDVGLRPSSAHTIERVDNGGNYSCGHCQQCHRDRWSTNCLWSTRKDQARNTRRNRLLTLDGVTNSIAGWAEELGISSRTIRARLDVCGWDVEKTLRTPLKFKK